MTDDLVQRLRSNRPIPTLPHEAADRIEQLEREKAVVSDLWEQQKEIALDYLTDCNKAADRIEAQVAEIERLREALNWYVMDDEKYIRAAREQSK